MSVWNFIKKAEHANAIMAIFTILIFLATGAYTIVALKQWNVMKGTLGEMQLERRPWLSIYWGSEPKGMEIGNDHISQGLGVSDIGKSPLLNSWGHASMEIVKDGERPAFRYIPEFVVEKGVMYAGDVPTILPLEIPAKAGNEKAIRDGTFIVISYGWVRYDDDLGKTYWQQFCNWPELPTVSPLHQSITHKACVEFNQAGTQTH